MTTEKNIAESFKEKRQWAANALNTILDEKNGVGDVSDGYHTFNELYKHRTMLFAALCNSNKDIAWKSKQHHDTNFPMYDGMFIAGMETSFGQATYHCDMEYWDFFEVKELDKAMPFDGHSPDDAINRIYWNSLDINKPAE